MYNIKNFRIMEAKVIIASVARTTSENNKIWSVGIEGEAKPQAYCKSAYKAMRFCFLLKKRTGLNISDNCLTRLSHEVALQKAAVATERKEVLQERVEDFAESHSVNTVLAQAEEQKPKKQRKPSAKKAEQTAKPKRTRKAAKKEAQDEQAGESQSAPSPSENAVEEKPSSNMEAIMKQYRTMKEKHPADVLLFRQGDFYFSYAEDATKCGMFLGITVTRKEGEFLAMFPQHALDTYLPRLIRAGQRVAICDDPIPVPVKKLR